MATQVQFRRGTTTETNLFTGAVGEVTVDTTKNVCVVHDGATSGGFPLLRQDGTNSLLSSGSLSSPSLKFSNSTTTGIYSPSPGSISIVNNGVANLTIDSSGAVNIPGNFLLSGNLSLPQGTVVSPSLKIGPGTQGFYSPTTEQLAISIDSTRRALFTTTAFVLGAPTGDCGIEIGSGATANRAAYLDLVGDTTYTDYGLRLIRNNAGPNATSVLSHRGTGSLILTTQEAAPITFQTTGLERARITAGGNFGIGTSSPISPLDVVGTVSVRPVVSGDGGILQVYGNAGAAAGVTIKSTFSTGGHGPLIFDLGNGEKCRIDSSGRLLVGTSTARINFFNATGYAPTLQIESSVETNRFISCISSSADVAGGGLILAKQRSGAVGGNTIVQINDELGQIAFQGSDGSEFVAGAVIRGEVDGTPGTNDMPGRLVFSTTADGASSPTEQWRINNAGTVVYNQPAPAAVDTTATLTVANLTAKIITSSTAAAVTMTLPLGTSMDTGFAGLYTNMAFEWTVINTGATNAVTIQANTGHTIVGSATVAASNSGQFLCRRTAANTWVTYRLSS